MCETLHTLCGQCAEFLSCKTGGMFGRIRNVTIRQQIGLEETIIKEIEQNQLTRYGHVQRMAEKRLPKIALKWMLKQKRARGRPKIKWMEGIKKAMNERNLNEGQWEDRKQWSLGVGQRRKMF